MTFEEIYPKVRDIIADVLVLDEDEVEANSRLISDLGAESIDFLDLVFQLEKEFKIKIPRGQLEQDSRGSLSADEFEKSGVVTAQGMEALKNYFSELPEENFSKPIKTSEIPMLFTVETFCRVVLKAIDDKDNSSSNATT